MAHQQRYIPILRAKTGEFRALAGLSESVRARILPLLEIQPIPEPGPKAKKPKRSIDQYLTDVAGDVQKSWPDDLEILVDDRSTAVGVVTDSGEHPLGFLFSNLRSAGTKAAPVVGLDRADAYVEAVSEIAGRINRACIRIESAVIGDVAKVAASAAELTTRIGLKPGRVDLLLDFGVVLPHQTGITEIAVSNLLPELNRHGPWKTLTIALTSFPERLGETGTTHRVPRTAFGLWQKIRSLSPTKPIGYGDYAIENPEVAIDLDPRILSKVMAAGIRYTADDNWLIVRGKNLQKHGHAQYHDLCAKLVKEAEYKGPEFSEGDAFIAKCARGETSTGNATTWRQVGVNHHVTLVAKQLASLHGP